MGLLKVHIIHGQEIHLEGEAVTVLELLQKYAPLSSSQPTPSTSTLAPLQNIVAKSLPKSEAEWLLIYASYHPSPIFTRHDLLASYKSTNRHSPNRTKNLSFNITICLKYNWFTALSPTTYSLSPQGQLHVQEILARIR